MFNMKMLQKYLQYTQTAFINRTEQTENTASKQHRTLDLMSTIMWVTGTTFMIPG